MRRNPVFPRVRLSRLAGALIGACAALAVSAPLAAQGTGTGFRLGLSARPASRASSFLQSYPRAPFSPIDEAEIFQIPTIDGAHAVWTAGWGLNADGSQNPATSWGYNTRSSAQYDPAFRMMELTFEASYLNPQGFHQTEAYIQFQDLDGTYRRPIQFELPFEGPDALKPVGFTSTDWFSFLDETSQRQRVKISNLFTLARNVPLLFSAVPDCAGCALDVGLEPQQTGELAVVVGTDHTLGNFKASSISASAFVGDGSGLTGIDASSIRTGTLPESVLPESVRASARAAAGASVRAETVGQVLLVAGRAVVSTSAVRAGSRIFLTHAGAVGQPGTLWVAGIADGRSFEIRSTSPSDDSPVNYWILEDR